MIDPKSVTIGTDAEIPLQLVTGEFFPVAGLVGGTKANPRPLKKLGEGFAVQEDNVNVEFNVPATNDVRAWVKNIRRTVKHLQGQLPPSMQLQIVGVAEYKPEFLQIPQCMEFGCTPDYNVYTQSENPKPRSKNPNLRSASAHIHVGWDNPTDADRDALVKAMDLTLGLYWRGIDNLQRKELYGKAGSHRPKEYGIEYRVLDNCWIRDDDRVETVFFQTMSAVDLVNHGAKLTPKQEEDVVRSINTGQNLDRSTVAALREFGLYWVD